MKKLFTTICMIAFMACHVYGDNKMALVSKTGMIKKTGNGAEGEATCKAGQGRRGGGIYYEETEDSTNLIQTVNRLEKKHPFLNLYLGKLYVNNYSTTYDVNDLLKGIRYIYKADMSGMMTPEYAKLLLRIYTTFDSIKPVDEEAEIGRLKKFIKQN